MLFKFLMLLAASFLALVAPMIAATTTLAVLLLVAVIAATAVWSRDDARRENALKVLRMLLDSFFQKKK